MTKAKATNTKPQPKGVPESVKCPKCKERVFWVVNNGDGKMWCVPCVIGAASEEAERFRDLREEIEDAVSSLEGVVKSLRRMV